MSVRNAASFTDKLLETTIDALWGQWRAVGGAAAGGPVSRQVDPEALCLASLALEPHEPRLWVAMADWLRTGAPLLSVQRVKNLAVQFPGARLRLGRLASVGVDDAKDARWRTLQTGRKARVPQGDKTRRRSAGPALQAPPALVLRMRAAFAVGVKADLLSFLLGQHLRVSVATAAAGLGYSTPPVFRAFQDLRAAGLVNAADLPAATEYWVEAHPWRGVLGGQAAVPYWGFWRELLAYACAVLQWEDTGRLSSSDYARGVSLRDLASAHEADLARAGVLESGKALPSGPSRAEWREFHRTLAEYITTL